MGFWVFLFCFFLTYKADLPSLASSLLAKLCKNGLGTVALGGEGNLCFQAIVQPEKVLFFIHSGISYICGTSVRSSFLSRAFLVPQTSLLSFVLVSLVYTYNCASQNTGAGSLDMRWTQFLPHLGLATAWVAQPQNPKFGYLAQRQYSGPASCAASTVTVTETPAV